MTQPDDQPIPDASPEERSARVKELIGHMLADYPPKK